MGLTKKMPKYLPAYSFYPFLEEAFQARYEEIYGMYVLPGLGEKVEYAKYQYPSRICWLLHKVAVKREVELLGLPGLEVEARCYDAEHGSVLTRNRKVVRFTEDYWQTLEDSFFRREGRS